MPQVPGLRGILVCLNVSELFDFLLTLFICLFFSLILFLPPVRALGFQFGIQFDDRRFQFRELRWL